MLCGESGDTTKVIVTERDRKLFALLFEHRVLEYNQIGALVFNGLHKTTLSNRLSVLCSHNFIRKESLILGEKWPSLIFFLTKKGLHELMPHYKPEITSMNVQSDSIVHDLALVGIRNCLESKSSVYRFYTENMLQSCAGFSYSEALSPFIEMNSDGAVEIETRIGKRFLAIEYERSDKGASRYGEKLLKYYLKSNIVGVFYICANDAAGNAIKQEDRRICENFAPKIFYLQHENMQKESMEYTFTNIAGKKVVVGNTKNQGQYRPNTYR